MAEELRFFVRSLVYLVPLAVVYWLLSHEPAGTALLVALIVAFVAFVAVGVYLAPGSVSDLGPPGGGAVSRLLGAVNRAIGFHERTDRQSPMHAGEELVPLGSPWPIIAAASVVTVGLGLVFGAWLAVPGLVLLAAAGLGWLTQLDRA